MLCFSTPAPKITPKISIFRNQRQPFCGRHRILNDRQALLGLRVHKQTSEKMFQNFKIEYGAFVLFLPTQLFLRLVLVVILERVYLWRESLVFVNAANLLLLHYAASLKCFFSVFQAHLLSGLQPTDRPASASASSHGLLGFNDPRAPIECPSDLTAVLLELFDKVHPLVSTHHFIISGWSIIFCGRMPDQSHDSLQIPRGWDRSDQRAGTDENTRRTPPQQRTLSRIAQCV